MPSPHSTRRRFVLAGSAGLAAATAFPAAAHSRPAPAAGRTAHTANLAGPAIDSTADWGARAPQGTVTILASRPAKIIVHHTVSANTTDYSEAQAHAHARWLQALHMDENGWIDTGYHFVNSRGGWLTEGRHGSLDALLGGATHVVGAHTSGQNSVAVGIANEGSYHDGATPPQAQWDGLVLLCAFVCQQYGIPATEIYGHLDFNATLCPGVFHDMLPQLRTEVAGTLGAGAPLGARW